MFNEIAKRLHERALKNSKWWNIVDSIKSSDMSPKDKGEALFHMRQSDLMLIVHKLGETFDCCGDRHDYESSIGEALCILLDLCAQIGMDIDGFIEEYVPGVMKGEEENNNDEVD